METSEITSMDSIPHKSAKSSNQNSHSTNPSPVYKSLREETLFLSPQILQGMAEEHSRPAHLKDEAKDIELPPTSDWSVGPETATITFKKHRFQILNQDEIERIQRPLPMGVEVQAAFHLVDQTRILVYAPDYSQQELDGFSAFLREELGFHNSALIGVKDATEAQHIMRRAELRGSRRDDSLGVVVRAILPDALAISRVSLKHEENHSTPHIQIIYRRPGIDSSIEQSYAREVEWELGIPARLHLQPEEWLREQLDYAQHPLMRIESVRFSRDPQVGRNKVIAHTIIFAPERALPEIRPWIQATGQSLGIRIDPILKPVSDAYFDFVTRVGNRSTGRLERPDLLGKLLDQDSEADFSPVTVNIHSSKQSRLDLSHQQTLVVDPRQSLDRDDGFSIMRVPGGIQLQVHITDVPALIRLGGEQFDIGLRKAFTVYGQKSIDPLHPRRLALEVGSLKQDRVRFTWTFPFTVRNGQLTADAPRRSLIRVSHAISYDDLYDALIKPEHSLAEPAHLLSEFHDHVQLRTEEPLLGKRAVGTGDWSHSLIAKNNVLVNEMVANLMFHEYPSIPWLYRAFQPPSEKDERYADRVLKDSGMGFIAEQLGREHRQRALRFAELTRGAEDFSPQIARVIGEAFYTTTPTPHAFFNGFYSHFSSPLRRGSDVVLGYQLSHALLGTPALDRDFVASYANYLSYQNLLESQRHRELLTKEELSRHEQLLGKTFFGSLRHVTKDCAVIDVPEVGRGIIPREDGTIEMSRAKQEVYDVRRRRTISRGDEVGICYETVNLWRFRPVLSLRPESKDRNQK